MRAAICDSCGMRFDWNTQLPVCPHDAAGVRPGVVEAFKGDDPVHANSVAEQVAQMLNNWRENVTPDGNLFKSGLAVERFRSHPIVVSVSREDITGPSNEYLGRGFAIVVKPELPLPELFQQLVLDQLPNEVGGLQIICEV
jgi:hypothetical protein